MWYNWGKHDLCKAASAIFFTLCLVLWIYGGGGSPFPQSVYNVHVIQSGLVHEGQGPGVSSMDRLRVSNVHFISPCRLIKRFILHLIIFTAT